MDAKERVAAGQGAEVSLRLWAVLFMTGMALMALELTGSRILAPRFGDTIYVWGSLISVFIGALAVGYFIGGKMADLWPDWRLLGIVIGASTLYVMVLPFMGPLVCRVMCGESLEPWESGPFAILAAAMVLFTIPSVLLGTVLPISVRLAVSSIESIGNISGKLFAITTLGSLVGTIVATFGLIPAASPDFILRLVGVTLAVPFLVAILPEKKPGARAAAAGVCIAVILLALPAAPLDIPLKAGDLLLDVRHSAYHRIAVVDTPDNSASYRLDPDNRFYMPVPGAVLSGSRSLLFYAYRESAIYLNKPGWPSAAFYTDMLWLPLIWQPDARRVLFIGGGGGVVQRQFADAFPLMHVDFVEVDQTVLDVAKEYFHLKTDKRLVAHCTDGRQYVRSLGPDVLYDMVIIDVFTMGARVPFHLTTREYLSEIRKHLSPDGVVFMNVISALKGRKGRVFQHVYQTFAAEFDQVYVFPGFEEDDDHRRNVGLVGTMEKERQSGEAIVSNAEQLYNKGNIPLDYFLGHARECFSQERVMQLPMLKEAAPLTDDWAPLDSFAF